MSSTPESDPSSMRALSRQLFGGAQYRIEVGAAVAERPLANTTEIAADLGIARQSVNHELQVLEQAGLLSRTPIAAGRKVFLVREDSHYWAMCLEARAQAHKMLNRASPN